MRQEMQEEMRRIEPVDEPKLAGESASGLDVDSLDSDHLAIDPEDLQPRAWVRPDRNRLLLAAAIVAGVLLLVFLPPFISVNRYRRQIATSIGNTIAMLICCTSDSALKHAPAAAAIELYSANPSRK